MTNQSSWEVAVLDVYDAPPLGFGTYTERMRSVLNGLKRMDHPGVLKMFDVGMLPDGRPYVVREMLSGTTLGDLMPHNRPPLGESLQILRGVCDVLIAAHDAGVVHRAVALDNVMLVGETKAVKLTDWGIGESIADEASRRSKLGTLDVTRRPVLTKKQDVYALGVMMHQLLGEIPHVLGELWSSMMAQDPVRRPTIHEVSKQLANWNKRERKPTPAPVLRMSAQQPAPVAPVSESMATPSAPRNYIRYAATALGCAALPLIFVLVSSQLRIEPPSRERTVEAAQPASVAARSAPVQRRSDTRPVVIETKPAVAVTSPPTNLAKTPVAIDEPATAAIAKPAIAIENPATTKAAAAINKPVTTTKAAAAIDKPVTTTKTAIAIDKPAPTAIAKPRVASDRPELARRSTQIDYTLMNDYQRVGRALLLLEREHGPEAVASLKQQFKRIRIDSAMANVYTRQRAAVKLVELQRSIDSAQAAYRSK